MKDRGLIHDRVAGGLARRLAAALVPRFSPVALLLAAAGCSHTQTIRVVDAQTGKPLSDVWVSEGGSAGGPYTLKTTAAGTVQFHSSGKQYALAKPGYEEARIELSGSTARIHSPSNPSGEEVKQYGDLVQVQLRPQSVEVGANDEAPPLVGRR